ncbi:centriole, cilia and spindle-associated protein [Sphaerodactylus townsendi]|uniref:Uncharacterized protein n=1 Tax=Sphaerodactylus townsendi TaxID=933632 RepID=A0ACB8GB63_9SAUR|nr:centriole, cilia and spindle-associated protein [Sphaerodactylus townsendi]
MVPSRCVKSEYMKRYKEPKWEACGPCYQELLSYRLSRRLLEQAHRPWFWDGWEQGSGSGGSPSPPGTSSPPTARQREEEDAAAPSQPDGPGRLDGVGETHRARPPEPQRRPDEEGQEKVEEKAEIKENGKKSVRKEGNNSTSQPGLSSSHSALASRVDRQQAKSPERQQAKSPERTEIPKGTKHPFALYGWGEKQTDTGSQKTHNVCASASANEIHESALRAKNRRQLEKRKLSQKRIHSAEVERTWRTKSSGPDNPWMTEYMRCYSARAR